MSNGKIILTADDYGAIDFVDDAIIESIKDGNINCVSTFVCFPTSMARVLRLVELKKELEKINKPSFGIGLHFSITAGNPIYSNDSSLCERVKGIPQFLNAELYPFTKIVHTHLDKELSAQIERLANWVGGIQNIDHVSNHHGVVYVDEEFFTVYSDNIKDHQIPIRSPKLWSRAKLAYDNELLRELNPLTRYGVYTLKWAREFFEARRDNQRVLEAQFKNLKFPQVNNDCIYGLPHANNFDVMLSNYPAHIAVSEFMFHLGYAIPSSGGLIPTTAPNGIDAKYFPTRVQEFQLLKDYDLSAKIAQGNIDKITFRQL